MLRPLPLLEACHRRYGEIFTLRLRPDQPVVVTSHPEAIRRIFAAGLEQLTTPREAGFAAVVGQSSVLLLNGPAHARQRRLLGAALHHGRLPAYGPEILAGAARAVDGWAVGAPFCAYRALRALLLDVLLRVVLDLPADEPALSRLITQGVQVAERPGMLIPVSMQRVLGARAPWQRIQGLVREADVIVRGQIRRARAEVGSVDDAVQQRSGAPFIGSAQRSVLHALLQARDDAGQGMGDEELRDELWTLLFAAHDTTAAALSWAVSCVLAAPRVHARLLNELGPAPADAARLSGQPYLDAIVRETLRLRPVFADVRRLLVRPMELLGYELPAGVQVAPSIYLAHRRAETYPEPEAFRPERWLAPKGRPGPAEYLPFGGGMRRCLGMELSLYMMKLVLGTIFTRVQVRSGRARPAQPTRRFFSLIPAGGVPITVRPR